MTIKKIGILGSGQMGGGIAQTAAQSGYEVVLADQTLEFAEKGGIAQFLRVELQAGRIHASEDLEDFAVIDYAGSIDGKPVIKALGIALWPIVHQPHRPV